MSRRPRFTMPPSADALTPGALTRQEFGRRLQELMLRQNMNQSDLARAAKLGRDSISTYVNGKSFPEPKSLKAIADVFALEPHELLPNTIAAAVDKEHPALEIKMAQGHPDKVWLRVNQMVTMQQASEVFKILTPAAPIDTRAMPLHRELAQIAKAD